MFESIINFFKKVGKIENKETGGSKDKAKERLHLVLMQDRANVSADFLELMKQEIIDVIKKYIVVDEEAIDVRLTNQPNDEGVTGAPSLYANIPIVNIKNDMMAEKVKEFKGIDFNKEMGLPTLEDNEEPKSETIGVIELLENYSESEKTDDNNNEEKQEDDEKCSEKQEDQETESEEDQEMFEEVDDDDDVTFDDLLKAAEAAEKQEAAEQQESAENNKVKDQKSEEINDKKNDNNKKKKNNNKTKDKQKKNN